MLSKLSFPSLFTSSGLAEFKFTGINQVKLLNIAWQIGWDVVGISSKEGGISAKCTLM